MSFELQMSQPGRAQLTGELCIFNAEQIKKDLLEALREAPELEADLSGVHEIDTSGVQLLLMAKREAARTGCRLSYVGHSDAVVETITLLHLADEFGDPIVLPA